MASGNVTISNASGAIDDHFGAREVDFASDGAGHYTITFHGLVETLHQHTFTFSYTGQLPNTDTATYAIVGIAFYSTGLNPIGQQQQPVTATPVPGPSVPTDVDADGNIVHEGASAGVIVGVTALSADPNGRAVTYSLTNSANGAFAIDPTTGVVTVADSTRIDYESAPSHAYGVTVQANDGTLSSSQNFSIAVNDVAPNAGADAYSIHANTTLSVGPGSGVLQNDSDVNGGAISSVLASGPAHAASFGLNSDGSFSYTPVTDFIGGDSFSYRASDGTLASALTNVTISVTNTSPVARNDVVTLAATQTTLTGNVLANDSDADGDALRVTSVYDFLNGVQQQVAIPASGSVMLQSNHGAFTISADGSYSFTANDARAVQNHYAEDPLVYSVFDGHGGTGRAQLDVNLAGQQRPSTETFNYNFVNATVSYGSDGQAYLSGPDGVVHNVTGVGLLIFNDGRISEGDYNQQVTGGPPPGKPGPAGSALVDDLYYDSQYHDVYLAGVDPELHYAQFGWHEGRNPDPYFNTNYYLRQNPDVAAAHTNPLSHYETFGWSEGRNPSPNFSTTDYELSYPDVAASGVDPLAHYLSVGELQNRVIFPANAGTDGPVNGFDPTYYLANNPDVAAADVNPLQHYLQFGWHEGRNASADFNTNFYESHNPDVAAAAIDPLIHYDQFGWHEGRDPSAVFSTSGYLTGYPDVAAANINPLQQFLQFGMAEGRSSTG
jgi:VCBS repeat-containing protein